MNDIIITIYGFTFIVTLTWSILVQKYGTVQHDADAFLAPVIFSMIFPPLALFFFYRLFVMIPKIIKQGHL